MLVRDILTKKGDSVYTILPQVTIQDAVRLLNQKHIGALIVEDNDRKILGIITERDILAHLESLGMKDKIETVMTPAKDLIIVHETDTVDYAMKVFTMNKIRHLPVFEDNALIGLISIGDAVKAVLTEQQVENKQLQDYITGAFPVNC